MSTSRRAEFVPDSLLRPLAVKDTAWYMRRKGRLPSPAMLAALVAALIMGCALMLTPVIGMADNGDFFRVANGQGLYKFDRYEENQYLSYFSCEYGQYQYFNEYEGSIFTTQVPLIQVAKAVCNLFTGGAYFDIRFMSVLLMLWCAFAIYLLVKTATYRVRSKKCAYAIAALCVYFFADTGYTAYFNSFYAEGLTYVCFLTAAGCALLLAQRRNSPYVLLSLFAINGLILTGAKQQYAPVGVLLGVLCVLLMFVAGRPGGEKLPRVRSIRAVRPSGEMDAYIARPRRFRTMAIGAALLLCMCGVMVYAWIPQEFVTINQYHAMTRGIMMTATNPEETLDNFGIDRQYALLNKSIYYERYPAVDVESDILHDSFYPKYGFLSVGAYYLSHPAQLLQMLNIAAENAYAIRPASLGNFERSTGAQPGAQTQFFTLHSSLKQAIAPKTVGFMLIWFVLTIALCRKKKMKCIVLTCCMLVGFSQIVVSILGAGDADLSKHVFLYNTAFDLINFMGGAALIVALCAWGSKRRGRWQQRKQALAAGVQRAPSKGR